MDKITYTVKIGNWSVDSGDNPRTELINLETIQSLESPRDACHVVLYAPPATQTGILGQGAGAAAGAFGLGGSREKTLAVQVRGQEIKHGDEIIIELTSGDISDTVMTARVHSLHSSFGQTKICGRTGMQKLSNTRLNQVYENQSLSQIVKNLAGQADVDTGDIEIGSTYSYFVVHESKTLLRQLCELARREGMDLYFNTDNKLTIKTFNKSSADHTFHHKIHILGLQIFSHELSSDHVRVYGESPSSNQGSDTWHWIAKDISGFQSEVGDSSKLLAFQDGVLRTKDAADSFAKSKFGAIKDQATSGRLKILGNPKVKLGEAIEIKDALKPELNGLFKVTSVRHVVSKGNGFLTLVDFSGQGGAGQAAGLLGQVGGSAGAIGL
jgi:hypothetical protein